MVTVVVPAALKSAPGADWVRGIELGIVSQAPAQKRDTIRPKGDAHVIPSVNHASGSSVTIDSENISCKR